MACGTLLRLLMGYRFFNNVVLWFVFWSLVGHSPWGESIFCGPLGVQARDICHRPCRCSKNRTVVSCRNAGLVDIPVKLPHNIRTLDLDGNKIASLNAGAFSNASTLRKLSLKHNNISYIHGKAFSNLTHMKDLYLGDNWIQNLPPDVFSSCPQLRELSLANNFLDLRVLNSSLSPLKKLHALDLSRNNIEGPELPQSFSNLTHLKTLIMRDMNLKNVSDDFFTALEDVHLHHLDLSKSYFDFVGQEAFRKLPKLKVLDLSYSTRYISIFKNIFWGLQNSTIDTLYLQHTLRAEGNDTKVPSDLFSDLENTRLRILHFEGNYLGFDRTLPPNLFRPLRSLQNLYLEGCDLVSLYDGAFHGLKHLQILSLRYNLITCTRGSYCGGIMDGLPNLERLDLSNNAISNAEEKVRFSGEAYPNLLYLILRNNSLEVIKRSMLLKLKSLVRLDLANNPINSVEPNSFLDMSSLEILDMFQCHSLTTLYNGTFKGLTNLVKVQMQENSLVSIEKGAFLGARKLEELNLRRNRLGESPLFKHVLLESSLLKKVDLGDNHIQEVPTGLLLPNLTHIYLDFNRISECSALDNIPRLKVLDLSFNSLASPSISCFKLYHDRPVALNLAGNPFFCSCDTVAFASWLNQSDIIIERDIGHICTGPKEALGQNLFQYKLSQWDCHLKFTVVPILAAISTVVALIILGIIWHAFRRGTCTHDNKSETEGNSDSSCSCNDCDSSCVLAMGLDEMQPRQSRRKKGRSSKNRTNPSIISEEYLIRNDEDEDMDEASVHNSHRDDDIGSMDSDLDENRPREIDRIISEVIESNVDGGGSSTGPSGRSANGRGPLPI